MFKENKKSNLIYINEKSFFEKIKVFPQFDIINNQIKIGLYEFFTDNIDSPCIIVSVSLITNYIKFFTLENDNHSYLEIIKNTIKSINWEKGCFNSLKGIERDELLKKTNLTDAILNHHFSNEIKTFYIGDILNPVIAQFIEECFKECGFQTKTIPFYNHFTIDIINQENKKHIINQLNSIISNDDNIIPLSKSDAYYIINIYQYKTQFSINELLWAIDNGLAFGYKIKNSNNNYNDNQIDNNKVVDENDEKNNDLVCWNYIKSDGKSANLFTKPEYRGKGMALKVKAKLTLSSIEKNILPQCSTLYENTNSISLVKKLGFKYSYSVSTMVISKNKINVNIV
ncbi:hypothetical protein ACTFIU_009769 [Dictyostelium citrinum]